VDQQQSESLMRLLEMRFRAHPWHGVPIGPRAPEVVTAYVEIVPSDGVKYEIDKQTGILKVDRPQKYSSLPPTLYGLIPRTLCAERVAELAIEHTGRPDVVGDGDPMDICILSEKQFTHGDILLPAIPIGGFRMLDRDQADDKIIAVMQNDVAYGGWRDIADCPPALIERLRHYFLTYKDTPGAAQSIVEIVHFYGREEALDVIRRSQDDYAARFSDLKSRLAAILHA
jgi:inorganic pyrophosphatase